MAAPPSPQQRTRCRSLTARRPPARARGAAPPPERGRGAARRFRPFFSLSRVHLREGGATLRFGPFPSLSSLRRVHTGTCTSIIMCHPFANRYVVAITRMVVLHAQPPGFPACRPGRGGGGGGGGSDPRGRGALGGVVERQPAVVARGAEHLVACTAAPLSRRHPGLFCTHTCRVRKTPSW
jgi:hypothetical protein